MANTFTEIVGKYATAKIFAKTIEEGVFSQMYDIVNCRAFEGEKVVCMPDVHAGASGPCGLVATIGNYVCPEHIGVDIGCSVSMIVLDKKIPADKYAEFEHKVKKAIPFGRNIHDKVIIDEKDFYKFLSKGFNRYRNMWSEMLMGLPEQVTEKWVSEQLKRLGMDEGVFYKSLGTVGGGNHFIEYDEEENGDLAGITLHFGSRNFGVKVCKYWMHISQVPLTKNEVKEHTEAFKKAYIKEHTNSQGKKDMAGFKDALHAHLESMSKDHIKGYVRGEAMKGYLMDMCFAQLYAQYNHMTVQGIIKNILLQYGIKEIRTITSTHNYIDLQDHTLRKSAIRSYAGEEILVPFNMRDGVAICEGLSNDEWLNSCAHGAGRKMSRSKAKKNISMEEFAESMKNIYSTTICPGTIDESPMAYKDASEIQELIQETCRVKVLLKPKINIKAADGGD